MFVERLAQFAIPPAPANTAWDLSPTAALRQAFDVFWWLVRAHMADLHGLPRGQALGRPPAAWLGRWPRADN